MPLFVLSLLFVIIAFYNRRFPIYGVRNIAVKDLDSYNMNILDVRDFGESDKTAIAGAVNIPIAYLKRNFNEIPNGDLYVVAANSLEKNVAIRLLRKKGFSVVGYTLHNHQELLLKASS